MPRHALNTGKVRGAWKASAVLMLGLATTSGLYFYTRSHERKDVHWATRIAAESLRAEIATDVEFEITGLLRLAMLANRITSTGQIWNENAEMYIRRRPGCIAIEALTANYERTSIVYASAEQGRGTVLAFGGFPVDLLKAAAESKAPVISGFVAADRSRTQRVTVVPIEAQRNSGGFVVAFFDVKNTFDRILADVKHIGFSIAILERGQERYRMVADGGENEAQSRAAEREVTLPGTSWELRVWPRTTTMEAMDAKVPELTLIAGAVISFLLASTVRFAHSAARQSRNLRKLNAELTEEIRRREQAQEGIRRAQEDLESRVRARTAELSAAKAKLEHEVTDHARAEESLQKLTGQLCQLQDEERRRLARELHDGATQNLIALGMNVASMRERTLSPDERTDLLNDSVRLIQQSVGELRTTSHLLHPPLIDELGLPVTLRSYVDGFSARSGIRVALVLDPRLGRLDRDVELGIFRVVQESLANVHRHSHSDTANILLCREDGRIRLEIGDEGTGIPPDVLSRTERGMAGVGIAGMRERVRLLGGRFEVHSGNTGTTIRILLPVMEVRSGEEEALGLRTA